MGQILTLEPLLQELNSRRKMSPRRPPRVVFTNGCFDILHVGHARYLREAKALGEILVVGLNSDSSVRGLKGPDRPIQDENDRAELLCHLASVDYVILFSDETPLRLVENIVPDILVKGGDWAPESIVGSSFVLAKGGQVQALPFHPGRSTSQLIERILKS